MNRLLSQVGRSCQERVPEGLEPAERRCTVLLAVQQTLHGEQHSGPHMSSTLSPEQAAQRVGLSRWTVSRALQAGRLRGVRDNRGRWRIEVEDLDAWLAAQAPPPGEHNAQ